MATKHRISGVAVASIAALMQWLKTEYAAYSGEPLTVRLVSSPGNLRQADVQSVEDKPLAYPFALCCMGEVALDVERGGLQDRSGTRGVMVNRDRIAGYAEFETMRPVNVTFGINFRSSEYDHVWYWVHALLLAAPKKLLRVESDEGFKVDCSVGIEPALTIPPLESTEGGSYYSFDNTLMLNTRIGVVSRHRLIRNIKISVVDGGEGAGPVNTRAIYDGELKTLLDSVNYDYHDLFDPASGVGKYTGGGPTT